VNAWGKAPPYGFAHDDVLGVLPFLAILKAVEACGCERQATLAYRLVVTPSFSRGVWPRTWTRIIHVDDDAVGAATGESWTDAYQRGWGDYNIRMATRPDRDAPFDDPVNLAAVNSAYNDIHASPSPDGSEFYFVRETAGGRSTRDIWVSYRID